ncbi:MAG TPA: GAF and ANTAR domain-containing protein [Nocardioides sp.]|nr:GAF and ANTAR domain-containing protein [Nocardioides sp.]
MNESQDLATFFAELSEELHSDASEPLTFEKVIKRAVETIPGCDHASITLRGRRGRAETVAATDEPATRADKLQYSLEEGPCVDAAFESTDFVIDDLKDEPRWPRWSAASAELGLRAAMAIRLHTDSETLGALNLYSESAHAFDEESRIVAMIYASHAADAMSNARLVSGLRAALESRHTIGIAQGVLAVRYDISYERAFQVLHRLSNDRNVKLRDLAQQILDERGLPPGERA